MATGQNETNAPRRKSEGYNASQLIGRVLGPVAAVQNERMPLVLEVTEREETSPNNWTDVDRTFHVLVTGKRAEGLAKLRDFEGSRVFVEGVLRVGPKGGTYILARKVMLLAGKPREASNATNPADYDPTAHTNGAPAPSTAARAPAPEPTPNGPGDVGDYRPDDEIPF